MTDDSVQGVLSSDAPAPAKPKKRVARKPRAAKLKVTRFDKDAVRLIQAGTVRLPDLAAVLGVDADQARARLLVLAEKGYLIRDVSHPDVFRVGIPGYDKFAAALKLPKPEAPVASAAGKASFMEEIRPAEESEIPPERVRASSARPAPPTEPIALARTAVDLAELLRQGAPAKPHTPVFTPPSVSRPFAPPAAVSGEKQACELCRAAFKLSVKNLEGAKFAHCVCGAAYHKDCYHAIVDGGTGCVRCGRKLAPIMDKHSEEALRTVKGVFD